MITPETTTARRPGARRSTGEDPIQNFTDDSITSLRATRDALDEPRQLHALVVDDAPSNRKLFALQVKRLNFLVTEVSDGAQALTACGVNPQTITIDDPSKKNKFDVIFMDSVMPIMYAFLFFFLTFS